MLQKMLQNNKTKRFKFLSLIFLGAICVLLSATDLNAEEFPQDSPIIEHVTDKHLELRLYKKSNEYGLREPAIIEIGEGRYVDDYQIYKNWMHDGVIFSFTGEKLGYFPAREMACSICYDEFSSKGISGKCESPADCSINLRAPYFPNGKYADFYNPQGEKILTVDLSSLAVCNENSICEDSKENEANCPSDCKAQSYVIDERRGVVSAQNSDSNVTFLILITIFALVIIIGSGIFWLKKKNNYKNDQN